MSNANTRCAKGLLFSMLFAVLFCGSIAFIAETKDMLLENKDLKQQIEQTKQCLRNSQYEEWELCYE